MAGRFLVVGGAGFIGSHLVAALLDRGDACVVFDNLRQGHRAAVLDGARFIQGDLANAADIDAVVADGPWDAVFHFAALSLVGESMRDPMLYLSDNPANAARLIKSCIRHGVERFVFSSTANLFGTPQRIPIDEDELIAPGSAYGESKLMVERMLHWAGEVHGLRTACLRYFNAAGSDRLGRLGEDHDPETHLLPLVIDAALGRRPEVAVFGTDYPTADGTCIRDYIHVDDVATAHLGVLPLLRDRSVTYNLGTGSGHSVMAVIRAVQEVGGRKVPHRLAERRAGDPAVLVASSARLIRDTGWTPRFDTLEAIVETAWRWREAHPNGYRPNDQRSV